MFCSSQSFFFSPPFFNFSTPKCGLFIRGELIEFAALLIAGARQINVFGADKNNNSKNIAARSLKVKDWWVLK